MDSIDDVDLGGLLDEIGGGIDNPGILDEDRLREILAEGGLEAPEDILTSLTPNDFDDIPILSSNTPLHHPHHQQHLNGVPGGVNGARGRGGPMFAARHMPNEYPNEYPYMQRPSPPYQTAGLPSPPDSGSEPPCSPENASIGLQQQRHPHNMQQQPPVTAHQAMTSQQPMTSCPPQHPHQGHVGNPSVPVSRPAHLPQSGYSHWLTAGAPHMGAADHIGPPAHMTPAQVAPPPHQRAPQLTEVLTGAGAHHMNILPPPGHHFHHRQGSQPSQGPPHKRLRTGEPAPMGYRPPAGLPTVSSGIVTVKNEPAIPDDLEEMYGGGAGGFVDTSCTHIKWQPFSAQTWCSLLDQHMQAVNLTYKVVADKGFNVSSLDEAFVCQKKNHFQTTTQVTVSEVPRYVKTGDGSVKPVDNFCLHFFGVKAESHDTMIKVEQSQADRTKKPFNPIPVELVAGQTAEATVGRLHFSETTANNMRKKGKPNPDQRFFCLVVALKAHSQQGESWTISAHMSEKIIVRASNPGQFENDVEVTWKNGSTPDTAYHMGRVGINTNKPDEALVVHGNVRITGDLFKPSDKRVKENFVEVDPKEQLDTVKNLRIYKYSYITQYGDLAGLSEDELEDTGVIAQELRTVLPDAVRETGDVELADGEVLDSFLVVNKDRIFMENVGAVKELCRLNDKMEVRIDELERMNKRLAKIRRVDSIRSTSSGATVTSVTSIRSYRSTGSNYPSAATKSKKEEAKKTSKPRSSAAKYAPAPSVSSSSSGRYCGGGGSTSSICSRQHRGGAAPTKPCSNKLIQAVIVILVLVMAFCLIAITTMYVLDKQENRNNKSPNTQVEAVGPPTSTLNASIPTILIPTSSKGPLPVPLPSLGECYTLGALGENGGGECEMPCICTNEDSLTTSTTTASTTVTVNSFKPEGKSRVTTKTPAGKGEGPQNPGEPTTLSPEEGEGGTEVVDPPEYDDDPNPQEAGARAGLHYNPNDPDRPIEDPGSRSDDQGFPWMSDLPAGRDVTVPYSVDTDNPGGIHVRINGNDGYPSLISGNRRRKRFSKADQEGAPEEKKTEQEEAESLTLLSATVTELSTSQPKVVIPYNYTVSYSACVQPALCSPGVTPPLGSTLRYSIPVSRFLPDKVWFTMRLRVRSNEITAHLCSKATDASPRCWTEEESDSADRAHLPVIDHMPVERNETHSSWKLPVGFYTHSTYTFRLAHSGASRDSVCKPDASVPYLQYDFHFFIMCN